MAHTNELAAPRGLGPPKGKSIQVGGGFTLRWSSRAGENGRKLIARKSDRIRLHAAGVHGFLDYFGSMHGREAQAAEWGDLQVGNEVLHPGNAVVGNGIFPAREKAGNDFISAKGFTIGLTLTQRGKICGHDLRQERGTNGAVGCGSQDAANGAGQPMHGAESSVGQGESAKQTREGHVFTGAVVAAVIIGGAQRARGAGDAVPTKGVGYGIGARADKGFDELGECIEPGAGGEARRQAVRQFRVHDGDSRQHERTAEADLDAMLGRRKNGVAGDFRAGAGGGGNGNERRGRFCERPAAPDDLKIIEKFAAVGKQGGNGLAGVNGAAAAEGDDEVAAFTRCQCQTVANGLDFRLAACGEDDGVHLLFAQKFEQRLGAKRVMSGDDQSAPAKFGGERAGIADSAGAEDDAIGRRKFKAHIGDGIRARRNLRGHLLTHETDIF